MSKAQIDVGKLKLFFKRASRYRKIAIALLIFAGINMVLLVILFGRLPNAAWLPDATKYAASSKDLLVFNTPVRSETVITRYGRAARYITHDDRLSTIYIFRSNPFLQASDCPNITNGETLLPSGCEKIGLFQAQPVYALNRSLPSGKTEYFVKLGQTFIFVKNGGDGGRDLAFLNSFVEVPKSKVAAYLADNRKRVEAAKAKQQAEQKALDTHNSFAYTRLDFTPAIPANLPDGWKLNESPIQIDGPDASHPTMVNLSYSKDKKQFVSVHSAKLSSFTIGTQCGPSPGYSMEKLPCYKVAGTDYYEAIVYSNYNDFSRYLYRPVGDSLVISHISVPNTDNKRPGFPFELATIQDVITLSARSTDKTTLKGSTYYRLYY